LELYYHFVTFTNFINDYTKEGKLYKIVSTSKYDLSQLRELVEEISEEIVKNSNFKAFLEKLNPKWKDGKIGISEISSIPEQIEKTGAKADEKLQTLVNNLLKLAQKYDECVTSYLEKVFFGKESKEMPYPQEKMLKIPAGMMPNFSISKRIDSYEKKDLQGEGNPITIEEYEVKSPEGDRIIFAMAQDKKGRVYIDNVYSPEVGMSSYGTPAKICQMGILVYKPEDYNKQVFGISKYTKEADSYKYTDISNFFANIDIIKKYKEELNRRASGATGSEDMGGREEQENWDKNIEKEIKMIEEITRNFSLEMRKGFAWGDRPKNEIEEVILREAKQTIRELIVDDLRFLAVRDKIKSKNYLMDEMVEKIVEKIK